MKYDKYDTYPDCLTFTEIQGNPHLNSINWINSRRLMCLHCYLYERPQLPGISLSGPILLDISVNSLRILADFLASDFRLAGIGLFTVKETSEEI